MYLISPRQYFTLLKIILFYKYQIKIFRYYWVSKLYFCTSPFFPTAGDKQVVLGMNGNSAFIQVRKFTTLGAECSFNVVNFNYGLNIESKSHRESSYLQVINNYDPNTGANTSNSYINVTEPVSDNKNKAKTAYNFGGSINPSIKIVALFYFK